MHELVIIGGGSGNSDYILPIAVRGGKCRLCHCFRKISEASQMQENNSSQKY